MKKLVPALVIAGMAMGGAAFADTYIDNVGVYFDNDLACIGDIGLRSGAELFIPCYVVLTGATRATVKGFELKLVADGPLDLLGFQFPDPLAINVGDTAGGTFIVGYASPQPILNRSFQLMSFVAQVTSLSPPVWEDNEAEIYLLEVDFPSIPEPLPAYLTGDEELVAMHPPTFLLRPGPAAIFFLYGPAHMCYPTSSAAISWDSLKSLYR